MNRVLDVVCYVCCELTLTPAEATTAKSIDKDLKHYQRTLQATPMLLDVHVERCVSI